MIKYSYFSLFFLLLLYSVLRKNGVFDTYHLLLMLLVLMLLLLGMLYTILTYLYTPSLQATHKPHLLPSLTPSFPPAHSKTPPSHKH